MSGTIFSAPEAYAKIVLHCMKYPTQAVAGLLVGKFVAGSGTFVSDVVPLTHTAPIGAGHPIIDAAVMQVAAVSKSQGATTIVGLYSASQRADDFSVSGLTRGFLKHIMSEGHPAGVAASLVAAGGQGLMLWTVHNGKLTTDAVAVESLSTSRNGDVTVGSSAVSFGRWNGDSGKVAAIPTPLVLSHIKGLLDAHNEPNLIDFEDHLEDCALDFYNPWVAHSTAAIKAD